MVNRMLQRLLCGVSLLPALSIAAACSSLGPRDSGPVDFLEPSSPHPPDRVENWPMPAEEGAVAMESAPIERLDLLYREDAGDGVTGASKLRVRFVKPPVEVFLKWKELPREDLDGSNNSPRKEIAAWEIQRLFLDPEDYVVPPSAMRCPPLDLYRKEFQQPEAQPTITGVNSVCGLASLWLQNVGVPKDVYDKKRFREDPVYAYFLSNFNLLTYLIAHRDGRDGNILVSEEDRRRQVFAIDNGISFGGFPYNFFVPNWHILRIPAVRKVSVERLRALKREGLDSLLVLYEFHVDAKGDLDRTDPGPPLDPDRGAMFENGTLQLGLTRSEIDGVWKRIQKLLADVDSGKLATF